MSDAADEPTADEPDADEPTTDEPTAEEPQAGARVELSPLVPEGEIVVPLEREGDMVWLVRDGHMTPEAVDAMNVHLKNITQNGLWTQQWGGRPSPPPPTEPEEPEESED
ncbi:hypothetical protein AB0A77_28570 [Streptomyces varsoviensis]|uniref:hypothetical protein n=1 Tax=Streptomyces varsoviensis TaxID=67373 RepID=UPI0033F7537A